MANTYKDIIVYPSRGSNSEDPNIAFRGANSTANTLLTLRVLPDANGTLSWEGANTGQLFSISNDIDGDVFTVSDISGTPLIIANANGQVDFTPEGGVVVYGANSTVSDMPHVEVTSSSTFAENAAGKILIANSASALTLTFAASQRDGGHATTIIRRGSGNVTIAVSGVTKYNVSNYSDSNIALQNGSATVVYTATNAVHLMGDITGSSLQGATGSTGTQGVQGVQGRQGTTGTQGVQGRQGAAGTTYTTASNVQLRSLGLGTAASGTTGELRATNNITAYYSDMRLKKFIGRIEEALDKVRRVQGFYWEANELSQSLGYKKKREVGVSAQEMKEILPEIIEKAPIDDKYMTLDYAKIVPLLIEAVKELDQQVQSQDKRIRQLEERD
jgi:hypothetical protein